MGLGVPSAVFPRSMPQKWTPSPDNRQLHTPEKAAADRKFEHIRRPTGWGASASPQCAVQLENPEPFQRPRDGVTVSNRPNKGRHTLIG